MQTREKQSAELDKRLDKVSQTPASFAFYVAIHDLVELIELHPAFPDLGMATKYKQLRQIHQGIEDTYLKGEGDLGHDRYMVIQDLRQIRKNDVSDSNPLWKKRELLRALCVKVCKTLNTSVEQELAK